MLRRQVGKSRVAAINLVQVDVARCLLAAETDVLTMPELVKVGEATEGLRLLSSWGLAQREAAPALAEMAAKAEPPARLLGPPGISPKRTAFATS